MMMMMMAAESQKEQPTAVLTEPEVGERAFLTDEITLESDGAFDMRTSPATRQQMLAQEPVVLRLRHISKSYIIKGSHTTVEALKDINLCELEQNDETPRTDAAARAEAGLATGVNNETAKRQGEAGHPAPSAVRTFAPVHRGEFLMIRGPSGGGKTTLLNIIGLIDHCTTGSIELAGEVITEKTSENHLADVRLRTLGFVFQTFNLISSMTAAENVELPMTLLGKLSDKQIRLRARQLLTLVGLRNRVNHLPSELSGGEQQRVTIARSLANSPALLLLDEPTGDLDTANTIEIMDLLMRINRYTKTTCIMVTHNPDVECYADRILYVCDGRFVKEVHNTIAMRLDMKKYAKLLEERERELTENVA